MNAPHTPKAVAEAEVKVISLYQKQAKVYPRSVSGRFARWRWIMVAVTQAVFYGTPWLMWNGRQAVWFDLETPRFHLFGLVLHPQELVFLSGLLVLSALALFFFTALAGRLWCGYACPQTVYTEMFLWIERHTEGDRLARMRLDKAPMSWNKLSRKAAKHSLWGLLALATGFSFVGYFIPVRELASQAVHASMDAWPAFWVLFYGAATYGNAGWMREQICKYMCPYARFQSTLLDGDSLVIAYDSARGDPRGSRPRRMDPKLMGLGSCVDCSLCVQVCPTGIDIRNGLQNECIGCAACIDACDGVMDKLGDARGLIRYATANGVAQGLTRRQMFARTLRPRVLVYGAAMLLLAAGLAMGLALRKPVALDVQHDRGALARIGEGGRIENTYRVQLSSRSETVHGWTLRASGLQGLLADEALSVTLAPGERLGATLRLALPPEAAAAAGSGSHAVRLELVPAEGGEPVLAEKAVFFVPR